MRAFLIIFLFTSIIQFAQSDNEANQLHVGVRASRILGSYPNREFPSPKYWNNTAIDLSSKFNDAQPAGLWIVSLYIDDGITQLTFPAPSGTHEKMWFQSVDKNEEYLNYFDRNGLKVWLQVEPGEADIEELMEIVLNRYKHHECVIGFGVDIEWYIANKFKMGQKLDDATPAKWEAKLKSIDTSYTLFVKHFSQSWMPPTYRGDIIFVDDSQDFNWMGAGKEFDLMKKEFKAWGDNFKPNPVAFQFGYKADKKWYSAFDDPMQTIGDALLKEIPNCQGLFWVDFTINDLFPVSVDEEGAPITGYSLGNNYPNPFNPTTCFNYSLPFDSNILLVVYNSLGEKIENLENQFNKAGVYSKEWNGSQYASGVYFIKMIAVSTDGKYKFSNTRKIILMK